jgi:hypothetical protein
MKISKFGKCFLREAALKPQLADCRAQGDTGIGISHEFISKGLTTMSLHTMSVIISNSGIDISTIHWLPRSCRTFVKMDELFFDTSVPTAAAGF